MKISSQIWRGRVIMLGLLKPVMAKYHGMGIIVCFTNMRNR